MTTLRQSRKRAACRASIGDEPRGRRTSKGHAPPPRPGATLATSKQACGANRQQADVEGAAARSAKKRALLRRARCRRQDDATGVELGLLVTSQHGCDAEPGLRICRLKRVCEAPAGCLRGGDSAQRGHRTSGLPGQCRTGLPGRQLLHPVGGTHGDG